MLQLSTSDTLKADTCTVEYQLIRFGLFFALALHQLLVLISVSWYLKTLLSKCRDHLFHPADLDASGSLLTSKHSRRDSVQFSLSVIVFYFLVINGFGINNNNSPNVCYQGCY